MQTFLAVVVGIGAVAVFCWMALTPSAGATVRPLPDDVVRRLGIVAGAMGATIEQAAVARFAVERSFDGKTPPADRDLAAAVAMAMQAK